MSAVGIVAFVLALLISVVLHEAGHFAFAKKFGMKATQFFVGFGPTVWSRQKGETEYGLKAIPAGGYVKIIGMTDLEEVEPDDEPRAFYRQPPGKRAIVLVAGSATHIVIAVVLLYAAVLIGGVINDKVRSTCRAVRAEPTQTCVCKPGDPASPAQQAGIQRATECSPWWHGITSYDQLAKTSRSPRPARCRSTPPAMAARAAGRRSRDRATTKLTVPSRPSRSRHRCRAENPVIESRPDRCDREDARRWGSWSPALQALGAFPAS